MNSQQPFGALGRDAAVRLMGKFRCQNSCDAVECA
jgi:hypothetical protein